MVDNQFNNEDISSTPSELHMPPSLTSPQNVEQSPSWLEASEVNSSSRRIRNRYKSYFTEIGLDGAADTTNCNMRDILQQRPGSRVRWRSQVDIHKMNKRREDDEAEISHTTPPATWHRYGTPAALLSRLSFLTVVLAIMIPVLHMSPLLHASPAILGAEAAPTTPTSASHKKPESAQLSPRQENAADICLRWSHQSAVINGTLYMYGGRAKTDSNQASNTWSELTSIPNEVLC